MLSKTNIGAVGLAVLEHIDRAAEVVLDELPAAGLAVHAGEDAGVGGGVDDRVDFRQGLEVAGGPEIGVADLHAEAFQLEPVEFAAGTDEVVEAVDFPLRRMGAEIFRQGGADKTADARDEDFHAQAGREKVEWAAARNFIYDCF